MTNQAPAYLSIETIRKWGACGDGRTWFREKFPQGGDYCDVMLALYADGRHEDASWLASTRLSNGPSADFIKADVKSIINLTHMPRLRGTRHMPRLRGGDCIVSALGMNSRVKLGPNGCGTLHWHDGNRYRAVTIYASEGGIEHDAWYRLENGKPVKVEAE